MPKYRHGASLTPAGGRNYPAEQFAQAAFCGGCWRWRVSVRNWARAVVDVPVPAGADVAAVGALLAQVDIDAYADDELHDLPVDSPAVMDVERMDADQFKNSRGRAHLTRQAVRVGTGTARPHLRAAAAGRNQRPD